MRSPFRRAPRRGRKSAYMYIYTHILSTCVRVICDGKLPGVLAACDAMHTEANAPHTTDTIVFFLFFFLAEGGSTTNRFIFVTALKFHARAYVENEFAYTLVIRTALPCTYVLKTLTGNMETTHHYCRHLSNGSMQTNSVTVHLCAYIFAICVCVCWFLSNSDCVFSLARCVCNCVPKAMKINNITTPIANLIIFNDNIHFKKSCALTP